MRESLSSWKYERIALIVLLEHLSLVYAHSTLGFFAFVHSLIPQLRLFLMFRSTSLLRIAQLSVRIPSLSLSN